MYLQTLYEINPKVGEKVLCFNSVYDGMECTVEEDWERWGGAPEKWWSPVIQRGPDYAYLLEINEDTYVWINSKPTIYDVQNKLAYGLDEWVYKTAFNGHATTGYGDTIRIRKIEVEGND